MRLGQDVGGVSSLTVGFLIYGLEYFVILLLGVPPYISID